MGGVQKTKKKCIYIGRVGPTYTVEYVKQVIEQKWRVTIVNVRELRTRSNEYVSTNTQPKSFQVVLPEQQVGLISFNDWPEGIIVRE